MAGNANRILKPSSLWVGFAALGFAVLGSSCVSKKDSEDAAARHAVLNVGIVFDKGGKDDKSFNQAAYVGAMKAEKDLHVYVKYVEAMDDSAYETSLREFASAQRNYGLIIAIGVSQMDAVTKIGKRFPKKRFAVVDAPVAHLPNVRALLFQEQQGSFLVGAAAAMKSRTGRVGFIGGMDIPLIRRFEWGYRAGAKYINPKIKLDSHYIGVTSEAWNNPAKAKELALELYGQGDDVIFAAAGASNAGLFDAAEEDHKYAIGVDSDQDWVKPGLVLTSMLKRVDEAVYDTIQDTIQGHFTGGEVYYGLKNHGVDYAVDKYNRKVLTVAMQKRLNQIKSGIIAGKIHVPDYYKLR